MAAYNPDAYRAKAETMASSMESSECIAEAGRLIIKEAVVNAGDLQDYIFTMSNRLSERVVSFMKDNQAELQALLDDTVELNYKDHDFFSASTLARTYLMRPSYGEQPAESPCLMYLRVAVHMYDDMEDVKRAYMEMAERKYTHATPTLLNAGTKKSQGSSCFLMTVDDSLDSILGTGVRDAGLISQHKGGLGIGLGRLRHSEIGTAGMSSGVLPVARIMDKLVTYVDQGGSRAGAGTAYLPVWHIDLWDFVNSTNNFKQSQVYRLGHLNTAIWMNDLFFQRVSTGGKWTVFCPSRSGLFGLYGTEFETLYTHLEKLAIERDELYKQAVATHNHARAVAFENPDDKALRHAATAALDAKISAKRDLIPHKVYEAKDVLAHIVDVETKSGFPFIMNGDQVNAKCNQSNIGTVNSSNLCTEITEVSTPSSVASCNLASVNLKAFARKAMLASGVKMAEAYDFAGLYHAVRSVVRNINQVIDHNYYPVPEKTRELNINTRPLGIGVSGFDDAVKVLDLVFDSPETEALNKAIFATMYHAALFESSEMAFDEGSYANFHTGRFTLEIAEPEFYKYHNVVKRAVETAIVSSETGIVKCTFTGCPALNGLLQFDMWDIEAGVRKAKGTLVESVYNREDDVPVEVCDLIPGVLSWDNLKYKVEHDGLRNSLLLTVMPTASTAQIMRNAESTEVHVSNVYTRTLNSGSFVVTNQHLVKDLEAIGLWSSDTVKFLTAFEGSLKHFVGYMRDTMEPEKFAAIDHDRLNYIVSKYKTMFEISQKVILKYSRQRAIYIDQSQSLNIFLQDPTPAQVKAMHIMGNQLGLKTGLYYLRQKPAGSTASFGLSAKMLKYKKDVTTTPHEHQQQPAATTVAAPTACPYDAVSRLAAGEDDCLMCGS